jgi:hypothetical protein
MKVLNLQCAQQHSFEGWFASEDDFQSQLLRDLVECPMCESKRIEKMPSAPRLNFGAQQPRVTASDSSSDSSAASDSNSNSNSNSNRPVGAGMASSSTAIALTPAPSESVTTGQADFLKALRQLMANTEDVGRRFADEARRMHYGDIEARSIRGQASPREAVELLEEGIEVMPLPMPAALKETLQ